MNPNEVKPDTPMTNEEAAKILGVFYSTRIQRYNVFKKTKTVNAKLKYNTKTNTLTILAPKFIVLIDKEGTDVLSHTASTAYEFNIPEKRNGIKIIENVFTFPWVVPGERVSANVIIKYANGKERTEFIPALNDYNKLVREIAKIFIKFNNNRIKHAGVIFKIDDINNRIRKSEEARHLLQSPEHTMSQIFNIHTSTSEWNLANCLNVALLGKSEIERNINNWDEIDRKYEMCIDILNYMYGLNITTDMQLDEMNMVLKNVSTTFMGFSSCEEALIFAHYIRKCNMRKARELLKRVRGY